MAFKRYRTDNKLLQRAIVMQRSYPVSCSNLTLQPWFDQVPTSPKLFGEYRITEDNVTGDYYKKRALRDWIPPNEFQSYHLVREMIGESQFTITVDSPYVCPPAVKGYTERKGSHFALAWSLGVNGDLTDPLDSKVAQALVKQTVTECLAKRQQGKANYFESLAELDQAFGSVTGPIESLHRFLDEFTKRPAQRKILRWRKLYGNRYKAYRAYPKVKGKKLREFLNLLSSEWLIFRYGISPIISDIQAAMKALESGHERKPTLHNSVAQNVVTPISIKDFVYQDANTRLRYRQSVVHEYSVRATWTDMYQATIFQELGLTFQNVVALPWELTRFSFVFDWIANVGDLIYANIPRVNLVAYGGSYFIRDTTTKVWAPTLMENINPNWTLSGTSSDIVRETTTRKRRYVQYGDQLGFTIKNDFRFDHWRRALDAVALAQQALNKVVF